MKNPPPKNVEDYIATAPEEARPKLKQVREAIREVAPDAVESISYGMPFYSYKGKKGVDRRLCLLRLTEREHRALPTSSGHREIQE